MLRAALVAALAGLALAGPAAGQGAPPDTVARGVVAPRPWGEQPRFVMLRSLIVPGWGQFHNRAWLKAAGVAGAEGWIVAALVQDSRALDRLLGEIDAAVADSDVVRHNDAVNRYNTRLDASIGRQWLLGGVLAYALVDAYVDAHFRDFDIEFRHDPALPEQLPADAPTPKGGGSARGGRTSLALRWHF